MCCAADVLEGKGVVQVSITVAELLRFHNPNNVKSPLKTATNKSITSTISNGTPSPTKANTTITTALHEKPFQH